ncbi:SET domain-containing protein 3 [Coemansia sp. RSA 1933]|nr:SET domain-containing protein 3 [Coemansia sp. RSA 1933]
MPSNHSSSRDPGEDSTPDEDQGLIRCICNIDDDDGFTIQCENCLVWQHAVCVGVEQDNVPDEYLCEKCNPRKLDVKRAVEYQRRRLDSEHRNAKEPRKRQKSTTTKAKRADESNDRKKRGLDAKQPRAKSGKPAGTGRDSSSPTASRTTDKGRDSIGPADSSYTAIDSNILGADVQVLFQSVLSQLAEQRNAVSAAAASVTSTAPVSLTAQPATNNGAAEAEPETEAAKQQTKQLDSDSGKKQQADRALSGTRLPNGNSNSHSRRPSLAAAKEEEEEGNWPTALLPPMVPTTLDDINNPLPVYKGLVGKERWQTGLFSSRRIERHRYVCEYRGQVLLKAAYKEDPKNYYELLRTTSPYSHFHPGIDICVDARRQGSEARFVRRSCSPNVVLKSMYVSGNASPLVYLGLFAQRAVEPDEELTVGWEWEDGELPALARMAPSDAEDYLSRPEGRRLSKVWRQAFAGVSCACPDQQCKVRRLFAQLNVEELPTKPEMGGPMKRRASRTSRPDTSDQDPPSPSPSNVQSLDSHVTSRSAHSRRGSAVSGAENGRGLQEASEYAGSNGNVSARPGSQPGHNQESRKNSVSIGRNDDSLHHSANTNGTRNSSTFDGDNAYEADVSGDRSSNILDGRHGDTDTAGSASGASSDLYSRKRKPSVHSTVDSSASTDMESRNNGNGNNSSSKKRRSSDGFTASKKAPQSTALPLKKLWMSKYLEECGEPRIVSRDGENMTIAENLPPQPEKPAAMQPESDLKRGDTASRRSSVPEESEESDSGDAGPVVVDISAKTEQHISSAAESGRNIIRSEPTDADAPTPPPTNSPPDLTSSKNATTEQAPVDNAAAGSKLAVTAVDNDSSAQTKDQQQAETEVAEKATDTNTNEAQNASAPSAAEKASVPPPKKQRLSLQEYNKRRRVNNPSVASKEGDSKDPSVVNTPEATPAPTAAEEPLQTANDDGAPPASAVYTDAASGGPSGGRSTTPPLPSSLFAPTESIAAKGREGASSQQRLSRSPSFKAAGSPARRSMSSSLPPQPPQPPLPPLQPLSDFALGGVSTGAGRGDDRPRSSTGYSNGTRIERSATGIYDTHERDKDRAQPGSVYRPRERDYAYRDAPGVGERETGEIAHRRERMRSQSRGRGDRDRGERRHNTFSGNSQHYHQPLPGHGPPPHLPPGPPRSLTPHGSEGVRGSHQRGPSDWRPGGGYSSQRMSPSPSFYGPGPAAATSASSPSSHAQPQQQGAAAGPGSGMPRRTGIGTGGSRGGSPLRK